VIAIVSSLLIVGVLVIVGLVVAPQIIRAAATEVSNGDARVTVTSTGASATIPVDDGWSYVVGPFDKGTALLRSPDGALSIEFVAASGSDPEAAVRAVVGSALTPFDSEPVGDATVVHARVVGQDAIAGAVVSGDSLVVFTCRPGAGYEAELAGLLSRIEVTA
jgi:hypothetical protein